MVRHWSGAPAPRKGLVGSSPTPSATQNLASVCLPRASLALGARLLNLYSFLGRNRKALPFYGIRFSDGKLWVKMIWEAKLFSAFSLNAKKIAKSFEPLKYINLFF